MTSEDLKLIEKYSEIIEKFKNEVCIKFHEDEDFQERDWYDLSIGWFLANGVFKDDAFDLALIVRYDFHYWI